MSGTATFDFTGKTVIVTGSTKGIGRGIARAFAEAGANVVVNSRTPESVEQTASDLNRAGSGEVIGITGDIGDPDDVERLVDGTIDAFDQVHVLVNNAAVWPSGEIPDQGVNAFDFAVGVNARGPFYAATLVARHMIKADVEGNIVNVTSQAGEQHGAGHGLYGVSKAAQNGVTWRMAHSLAEYGIRVNAVSTNQTDSYQLRKHYVPDKEPEELTPDEIEQAKAERAVEIPLGQLGEPEDIADGVCFLASDAADYVTGHILRVSGGKNLE